MEDQNDMILPDDYEAPPEALESPAEEHEEPEVKEPAAEDTKPAAVTTETKEPVVQEAPKVKIKYDHEEKEISLEEAATLAQKGLNYDRGIERAKQEAADAAIAELGYSWNGAPITTVAEYKQAQMEQELMEKYQGKVPDELMKEIVAGRKDREERAKEKSAQAEEAQKQADLKLFLDYFQEENDRPFDPQKDTIPQEVWDANAKGTPLQFAYMKHQNKQYRSQLKVAKQNEENQHKAPVGSVTSHGSNEVAAKDDFERGFDSTE